MALAVRSGSTRRWRKLRAYVLRRDGKRRCQRCGGRDVESCNVITSYRGLRAGSMFLPTAGRCVRRVTMGMHGR